MCWKMDAGGSQFLGDGGGSGPISLRGMSCKTGVFRPRSWWIALLHVHTSRLRWSWVDIRSFLVPKAGIHETLFCGVARLPAPSAFDSNIFNYTPALAVPATIRMLSGPKPSGKGMWIQCAVVVFSCRADKSIDYRSSPPSRFRERRVLSELGYGGLSVPHKPRCSKRVQFGTSR
jgi:hypothetical protein